MDTNVTSPSGRISRTGGQLSLGMIVSITLNYLTLMFGWDLDPGAGTALPDEMLAVVTAGVGWLFCWYQNRKPRNPGAIAAKRAAKKAGA